MPEYTFAVDIKKSDIKLSSEHKKYKWVEYNEAIEKLKYDSNKTALWELNERLKKNFYRCLDGDNMLKIYNLKDKQQYINEVAILTQKEWGKSNLSKDEFENKITKKVEKIKGLFNDKYYCKLILLDDNELIGFISIFPRDGDERKDLSPWYATMYVKEKYRGKGYSKILSNAILEEAKKRNIKRLYLKTELENYYEKFGAQYLENLNEKEKIYYFDL